MKTIFKIVMASTIVVILLIVGAQGVLADTSTSTTNTSATHAAVSEVRGVITAIDKTTTPPAVTITPKEGSAVVVKVDRHYHYYQNRGRQDYYRRPGSK